VYIGGVNVDITIASLKYAGHYVYIGNKGARSGSTSETDHLIVVPVVENGDMIAMIKRQ
jgi:hypothetical protein